ncbi:MULTISPECIES: peptidase [spotted fever group]|uniref:Putative aTP-dependent protease subunit C (ClpC)-like protein n=1 Tax=Rickettsia rhipicephali str. Ect TaxID=1359199 RepID=A0A0F3PIW3_RICRH|nr:MULTISPECIES: peptidase [spotted fever group]KJV79129.1 putative aTP-dependent protease subunit C (ClpC)-like protein [Rickettsia rhipicephali str. Ect]
MLSNWTVRYGTNIDDDILSCFVHYCLDSKDIKLEDIKSIQDKDRILLLLDGYDEVAVLSQSNLDYRDIMDSVFQYKNIVMNSRPNAVIEAMSNRFERKVDNTGWDSEGIEQQYVHKNFEYDKELGTPLKIFLDTHSQIKAICEVPINTELICLVWSDQTIRDKFQKKTVIKILI